MITIVDKPDKYHSGYNPVIFRMDSNNKNRGGFKYLVDIYNEDDTLFRRLAITPDIRDNNRGRLDISRILQDRLDYTLPFGETDGINSVNHYYKYKVKFGEKSVYEFKPTSITATSTYIRFSRDVILPVIQFVVGDLIRVNIDSNPSITNNQRLALNRVWRVSNVSTYSVEVEADGISLLGTSGITPITGNVRYSNNRFIETPNLLTVDDLVAVNTSLPHLEYIDTLGSLEDYDLGLGGQAKLLTSAPKRLVLGYNQPFYLSLLNSVGRRVYFVNDLGHKFYRDISLNDVTTLNIGTDVQDLLTPDDPLYPDLILDKVKSYDVYETDALASYESEILTVVLDKRCTINDNYIVFLDRLGSFGSFAFQLKETRRISTSKEDYSSTSVIVSPTVYDSQIKVATSQNTVSYTLNTNWLTEDMNRYFEELLTSRVLYLNLGNGDVYPVTVNTGSFNTLTEQNRRLFRRTIEVEISNKENIN